ncbi:hypothetical protein EJB05_24450 [Eragrostis curvula]|uniref:Uncharacterized protein n=1 Tax=Eragrostis curvula TaxID=38414 RepID=A0A5J9V9H6_9POAL|nr:hypothetical protein EJB05_24450 [Eragrostis curvula]
MKRRRRRRSLGSGGSGPRLPRSFSFLIAGGRRHARRREEEAGVLKEGGGVARIAGRKPEWRASTGRRRRLWRCWEKAERGVGRARRGSDGASRHESEGEGSSPVETGQNQDQTSPCCGLPKAGAPSPGPLSAWAPSPGRRRGTPRGSALPTKGGLRG